MVWYVWLFTFLICLVIEILTMTLFVLCFSFGALIAMISSLFGVGLTTSIAIFAIVSLISMLFIRPFIKKYIDKKKTETNVDSLIGQQAAVIKDISATNVGQVKVNNEVWLAISNQEFKVNDIVKIVSVDGTKLVVEKNI